jgi:hypothetical protein
MNLIEEIKEALSMEIRSNSQGSEYLEAVINTKDLELLNSLLRKYLGSATKEYGKETNLPKEIQNIVDSLGGLRNEQSFFYRQEGRQVIYAAIWPWKSDPNRITLKSGVSKVGQGSGRAGVKSLSLTLLKILMAALKKLGQLFGHWVIRSLRYWVN